MVRLTTLFKPVNIGCSDEPTFVHRCTFVVEETYSVSRRRHIFEAMVCLHVAWYRKKRPVSPQFIVTDRTVDLPDFRHTEYILKTEAILLGYNENTARIANSFFRKWLSRLNKEGDKVCGGEQSLTSSEKNRLRTHSSFDMKATFYNSVTTDETSVLCPVFDMRSCQHLQDYLKEVKHWALANHQQGRRDLLQCQEECDPTGVHTHGSKLGAPLSILGAQCIFLLMSPVWLPRLGVRWASLHRWWGPVSRLHCVHCTRRWCSHF